ncbi:fungal-specific transcription factor domain-containing protein [Roridomyces roridus]|uniref:Fungal-specific transcription factor domain-containing protein n=1 Tax=Roridomyces roridus TaxID=1738132 RepID=A0AAD7FTA3_9AGAR|nr:fungal-specific transcription factor domain-containing protein [Roridomyces roridus]
MSSSDSSAQDAKKKKLQGACDMCYKRKVRCDSAEMPDHKCTNCTTAKIDCTHERAKFRNTPLDLKTGQQHVAEILSTSSVYIPTKDPALGHHILVQVARYARELEEMVASLTSQTSPTSLADDTLHLQAFEWDDTTSPATTGILSNAYFRTLSISDETSDDSASPKSDLFHGKSSSVQFVRSALKGMNGNNVIYAIQRPEFWMTPPWEKLVLTPPRLFFPDDDLLHTLVQIYFAQVNPIFCILHSRTFQESIAAGLHFRDHKFGKVVMAVCAVGSRYSEDPRVLVEGVDSQHSCGWKWFRQVRLLQMPVSPEASLYELQLIALSILYLSGFTQSEECWLLAGLGVRLAQGAGAHLRAENAQMDPLHRELHKRVFWILVVSDILTSSFKGRPRMTYEVDVDADLPVDVPDEYWGVPISHRSTGTPSNGAFLVAFLKLFRIYGTIQHEIYPADKTMCEQEKVLELDSELNGWADSVPEHLRWDPNQENQIYLDQSAAIYAIYYHAQMLIHRPFIPIPGKPPVQTNFPSLAICANAARACGHVLDVQARRGRGLLNHPHVMSALFESAIVLLINVWGSGSGGKPRAAETVARAVVDVQNFVNVLRLYERRWRIAGIRSDILSALINQGRPPPDSAFHHGAESTLATAAFDSTLSPPSHSQQQQQQRQELELSAQEPSHLFALPIHTEELGALPIYDSFEYAFDETLRANMDQNACGVTDIYGTAFNAQLPQPPEDRMDSYLDPGFLVPTSFDVDISSNFAWQDWGGYSGQS